MPILKKFAVLSAALALTLTAVAQNGPLSSLTRTPQCRAWVDSVYNSLTERQRVAQLMCPKVVPTQGATSKAAIKRLVGTQGVGALLFTEGSVAQYAEMTNYAQSIAKVPVIFTFDGEWGLSMRIKNTPRFPHNMGVGAISDDKLIEDYGREMARECKAMGIQVNFAPVADVNSNPANPVIGYRSFGSDPQRVARQVVAYSRGLEQGGVQAVAKHFPGHGDTDSDSHKTLPTINHSMKQLEQTELVPFKAFTEAGLSGVMMAHMSVPAIDKTGTATSMAPNAYKLLRDIGFDGLVYTDAMGMKGAVAPGGVNNCLAAIMAGADVVECAHPVEDIDAVMAALKSGKIKPSVIEERCKRVLAYKYALGMADLKAVDTANVDAAVNSPQAEAVNRRLHAAMMTVVYNRGDILPLRGLQNRTIAVVNLGADKNNEFADFCSRYAKVDVYAAPNGAITATQLAAIKEHNTVIIAVYNDKAATSASFKQLEGLPGAVAVMMVNPYKARKMMGGKSTPEALLMAYDNTELSREYAAQAIFGGIDVDGTLPVDITGIATTGTGVKLSKIRLGYSTPATEGAPVWMTDSIDALMNALIDANGTPGAQVLVAQHGKVLHDKAYGRLTAGGAPVTHSTMYDLASVSKALGTLPGVMLAVDSGVIDIEAPASRYIPGLRGTDKEDITIRQLLFHETGMPASMNVFDAMIDPATYSDKLITPKQDATHNIYVMPNAWGADTGKLRIDIISTKRTDEFYRPIAEGLWASDATFDTVMSRIYNMPLRKNKNYNYSCLNFALLMDAEQHATGKDHRSWVSDRLWKPLGAWSISYAPALDYDLSLIAPTEVDTYLRRQHLRGYVHDEMAAFSGGVSGNAGLFANADDLAKICQMWLNGGTYGGDRIMSEETVRTFTTEKSPTCRRGLGFDKPDVTNPDNSPTCEEAGEAVFGHLGFTGTIFWVDPANDLFFIFLTNRVDPTRDSRVFNNSNIRPQLFRQVLNALAPKE